VGNLSWDVSWQDLKDHFKAAGNVVHADVMTEAATGRSKGCGLVTFGNEEDAANAISTMHDSSLNGRMIFVREDREAASGGGGGGSAVGNTVYVGNLSWDVSWQDLKDHFKSAGHVVHADVMMEAGTGRSKGCGLVQFSSAHDAANAINTLHDSELNGRSIFVREDRESGRAGGTTQGGWVAQGGVASRVVPGGFAMATNGQRMPLASGSRVQPAASATSSAGCKLYVGNLSWDCTWQELKDLLREAGSVVRADIAQGSDGRSRGFGTVVFSTTREAAKAIQLFNETEYKGRTLQVHPDAYA